RTAGARWSRADVVTHLSAGRDREHAEAHLVGRALAPEDVARRELLRADDRLVRLRVVEPAAHADRVAGAGGDRLLEVVDVLPMEVPGRDVEERPLVRGAGVEDDRDVPSAQVHVARDAVDRLALFDRAVAGRRDRGAGADRPWIVRQRAIAEP